MLRVLDRYGWCIVAFWVSISIAIVPNPADLDGRDDVMVLSGSNVKVLARW